MKQLNTRASRIVIEPTEDGMFIAYFAKRMTCYAYGESEEAATDNLLNHYDFNPENWSDVDEYAYLAGAMG